MSRLFNTDLDRPATDILEDLRVAAQQTTSTPELKIGIVAVPFGTLLVKLGQDAQGTADAIRRFTKWLVALTLAVVALTVALLTIQVLQQTAQTPERIETQAQGNESGQKPD